MGISVGGVVLNQRQLDAITPVMNDLLQGKVKQSKFEAACITAMKDAGCPVGYDQGLDKSLSIDDRARRWIVDGQVGMSSKAIWAHMTGTPSECMSAPSDPDDLNRCLLLLDLVPEWTERMGEMATHGKKWEALAPIWADLTNTFLAEVGLDWCKGNSAPETYQMMRSALAGQGVKRG
ncbi:hypothetical protein [Pseudomonas sp. GXZC]|uniref:hypothetical protein n=1 Tax=Pseudomonas sp. GXZC TaxID=3003351 RepID=UPI0022AA90FC|nr:hypothetical protein [Pseudomonas sp. GXZC]WAT32249.1 hypothetical protein OZ428_33780 [Pseudomonas sp. GXZC]